MNNLTNDNEAMIVSVENIKKRYLNRLNKILKAINVEYEIIYSKKIDSITGCKTIIKDFKDEDQYINPVLKDNLDPILDLMKKTYIENTMDAIMYKEIRNKLIETIEFIENIDLTNAIKLTNKNGDDMVAQGIEEIEYMKSYRKIINKK